MATTKSQRPEQGHTIIIADDHPIFRNGLRDVLESDPALKLIAQLDNGADALKAIQDLQPDVAVLDFHMPKMTGLEVIRAVRTNRLTTKMILLTMYDDQALFDEAISLEVGAYVLKESAASDLVTAIKYVMQGKRFISPSLTDLLLHQKKNTEIFRKLKPGLDHVTPKEKEVLRLIAGDKTTKEIAGLLNISPRTVESHRQSMCYKLGLSGSHRLLKFAYENKSQLG
ncbi:MAG: two-component response regulator [Verrucomicrobiales bacterium]|jgi:DNA-binding NarL/FixJ family response regulator|nr:two-component response regulator [Verrucomicrobiales bacterium]MDB6130107.1 two-component response regulator [Verrucomicrobiales bacterium]